MIQNEVSSSSPDQRKHSASNNHCITCADAIQATKVTRSSLQNLDSVSEGCVVVVFFSFVNCFCLFFLQKTTESLNLKPHLKKLKSSEILRKARKANNPQIWKIQASSIKGITHLKVSVGKEFGRLYERK